MSTAPDSSPVNLTPHELPALGVVLVAAGKGERLGAQTPKAFVELSGSTLIEHCVRAICALPHSGHLVVVVPDSHAAQALSIVEGVSHLTDGWEISVIPGGRERHESVRFGLSALSDHIEIALIHDAARPLTPTDQFERVGAEVHRTGKPVIPALAVVDTVKRVGADGAVHETVDRSSLVSVQTPQGFPRELISAAHETLRDASNEADAPTDDAEVVQRAGATVLTVPGDPLAHKLTTPADLRLLEALLRVRSEGEK
ncbi:2-C-methyl-D-erythritol 4-phosphate cytidylyltransferase [Leucobacter denitrificans]|uniref:2-C-methyl-D-erythritol 4-phosphate cytidylyltransferase n=1 Tax=Leucobacter denitrificans TaxID=683042 RepID=A0A7G9S3Z2_9MICO|nr:2-C-methyl-D-erythritol 4-phosphate cytidylyltransferase [Leucobacter denitrificans]QNN62567.1 2-C-methyl-D-erythritol 4-phosphate cytidylyltransferase [Leucobacter denitrificans]